MKVIFQKDSFLQDNGFIINGKAVDSTSAFVEYTSYIADNKTVRGTVDQLSWEGVEIVYGNITTREPVNLDFVRHDAGDTVKIYFGLRGHSTFHLEGISHPLSFNCNEQNILYIPGNCEVTFENSVCEGCKNCIEWQFLEINLSPAFFEKYLPGEDSVFAIFRENMQDKKPATFYPHNINISLPIYEIVSKIMQCNSEGIYKRLSIESKVLELMMLQFKELEEYKCPVISRLKKSEVEKIYKAREILLCNIDNPCPLMELALKVGTNECTLKKGFKEVFGSTVFGYLYEVRMKEAHRLLIETENNISEVAEKTGYKNATHFTTAFKRKYGILPSKLRQGR